MDALFIGRFQPFHLGHLSVIKRAVAENDRVLIGIGSAEENFLPENPFTAGERFQMIEAALNEAKIQRDKYYIVPIRNINNYALWPRHVELLLPPFGKIYTGSDIVRKLFENENLTRKNPYEIINATMFYHEKSLISGSAIRELMLSNKNWEKLVPDSVTALIKNFKGVERLKSIQ